MPKKKKIEATPEVVQAVSSEVPGNLNVTPQYYLRAMQPILEYRRKQSRSLEGTILHIPSLMKIIEVAQAALDDQAVPKEDCEMVRNSIADLLKPVMYDQTLWLTKRKIVLEVNHEDYTLFLYVLPRGELKSERTAKAGTPRQRRKSEHPASESHQEA